MKSNAQQGYQAYRTFQASELDQKKLILMMFNGSIGFLDKTLELLEENPVKAGEYLKKAKSVLLELMSSLNLDEGGEMGEILYGTYQRLFTKLNAAHMADDIEKIREVRHSLVELGEAWQQVFESDEYHKLKNEGKFSHVQNQFR